LLIDLSAIKTIADRLQRNEIVSEGSMLAAAQRGDRMADLALRLYGYARWSNRQELSPEMWTHIMENWIKPCREN
jgi:hypothetical protein